MKIPSYFKYNSDVNMEASGPTQLLLAGLVILAILGIAYLSGPSDAQLRDRYFAEFSQSCETRGEWMLCRR